MIILNNIYKIDPFWSIYVNLGQIPSTLLSFAFITCVLIFGKYYLSNDSVSKSRIFFTVIFLFILVIGALMHFPEWGNKSHSFNDGLVYFFFRALLILIPFFVANNFHVRLYVFKLLGPYCNKKLQLNLEDSSTAFILKKVPRIAIGMLPLCVRDTEKVIKKAKKTLEDDIIETKEQKKILKFYKAFEDRPIYELEDQVQKMKKEEKGGVKPSSIYLDMEAAISNSENIESILEDTEYKIALATQCQKTTGNAIDILQKQKKILVFLEKIKNKKKPTNTDKKLVELFEKKKEALLEDAKYNIYDLQAIYGGHIENYTDVWDL